MPEEEAWLNHDVLRNFAWQNRRALKLDIITGIEFRGRSILNYFENRKQKKVAAKEEGKLPGGQEPATVAEAPKVEGKNNKKPTAHQMWVRNNVEVPTGLDMQENVTPPSEDDVDRVVTWVNNGFPNDRDD